MSTQNQWDRYQSSIQAVIDYIHDHPAGPVDNDTLAGVACLSTYHWHRIYRGIVGETAIQTVRGVRMHKAALELIRTSASISDIGQSVGYPSVQSFTRTFKSYYGQAPADFRQSFSEPGPLSQESKVALDACEVEVVERDALSLIGLTHHGDYAEVGRSFQKVFAANIPKSTEVPSVGVGVYFQDPSSMSDFSVLRSFAGVAVSEETSAPEGFDRYTIPATPCAVVTFRGPHASLEAPYLWLYKDWLPNSGLALADHPPYEMYLNDPMTTAPEDLVTKICIPVL